MVHKRAGNSCEFPAEVCERPNNKIVHHLTGAFEGYLAGMDRQAITDPNLNALMLCDPHADTHDAQESFQVASLQAERWKARGTTLYERKYTRSARVHRRRYK